MMYLNIQIKICELCKYEKVICISFILIRDKFIILNSISYFLMNLNFFNEFDIEEQKCDIVNEEYLYE